MTHLVIICFIFILLFSNILAKLEEPRIYPQKSTIVVDSGTDMTLGCIGKEPVKWTFYDGINKSPNNFTVTESIFKSINNQSIYGILLTVFSVSHLNIGFYCCHGKTVGFVTPTRSKQIYVYIRDEERLSFFPMMMKENTAPYNAIVPIPCRPTSPDVNISLSYRWPAKNLTVDHYYQILKRNIQLFSNGKVIENKFPEEGVVQSFHPVYGLAIRHINPKIRFNCTFERNNMTEYTLFQIKEVKYDYLLPHIDGPDVIVVQSGEDLILNCTTVLNQVKTFKWSFPNSSKSTKRNIQNLPPVQLVRFNKLLMSTLTIKNIGFDDEGEYECKIMVNTIREMKTKKYVAVLDNKIKYVGPKIVYPTEKEIQINAMENLTLICEGQQPVTWSYSKEFYIYQFLLYLSPSKKIKNNDVVKHETNSRNGIIIYTALLQLESVHHMNTGFYYCHENNTVKNNPYKSDSLYLFVKDNEDLRATYSDSETMYFTKNANVTIPCRPSSRDVRVNLRIANYKSISNTYDPRFGFTVNMTFDTDYEEVYCIFELEGYAETTKFLFYHSKYFLFESITYMDTPVENIVYVGEEFNLTCRVVLSNNYVFGTIIWDIPNSNRTNINVSYSSVPIHGGKVLTSILTIKDIQIEDEGLYNCSVPENTNYINSYVRENFITVHDRFDVKPIIDGLKNNWTYFGADMTLYCNIEIDHNSNFDIDWSVPMQNKELMTKNIEYIPNLYGIVGRSTLQIKNITFDNQGNYTCTALDSLNRTKYAVLDVTVQNTTKPRIIESNMNDSTINIAIGQSVEMECIAEGIPFPKITWKKDGIVIYEDNNSLTISSMKPWDAGQYTCNASTHVGWDFRKINLNVLIEEPVKMETLIAITCVILLMIIILSVIIVVKRKKDLALRKRLIKAGILNFETGEIQCLNPKININMQGLLLPYDRKWDIPGDRIKLGNELGFGNFGIVLQAEVFGIFRGETIKTVAVKMVPQNSDFMRLNDLISELKLMTHIGRHINIVNLLGACTENLTTRQLMIVVEYCKYGNVRSYLLNNRLSFVDLINPKTGLIEISDNISVHAEQCDSEEITTLDLVRWAFQVARGMEYLASRKILHADLAARNILLADDKIVKISDFGMSKNLRRCSFYKKKYNKCPMPIKWMALEAIRDGIFSIQSDVWSFGIVLWEFFSLGRTPYPDLETNFKFFHQISAGYRMEQPHYSTKEIYQIMLECWQTKPVCRPLFTDLVDKLRSVLQQNVHEEYMELNLNESYENQEEVSDYFAIINSPDYLSVVSNYCNVEIEKNIEDIPMDNI